MKPHISVVIPAYNEEKYLSRCLQALANQTYPKEKYEIIVVDNNSTDKTSEIAKAYGAKVVLFNEKQGVSATREYGVIQAQADLIAFTDADISVSEDWLAKIDSLMKDEQVLCLGGRVYPRKGNTFLRFNFWVYDGILRIHQLVGKVLPWGSNMIVRKHILARVGGFDPEILSAEDWDVSLRIQSKFGWKASRYEPSLTVFTETRKQDNPVVFIKYIARGLQGYWNFIILGKKKLPHMINVR